MILAPAQAQAVHAAMLALNPVNGVAGTVFIGDARIRCHVSGRIAIWLQSNPNVTEQYPSQADFAAAYGLGGPKGRLINVTVGTRFWDDHAERAPYDGPPEPQMPEEILVTKTRVTLRGTPEQFKGLRDDAAFYCHPDGPDECPPGLRRSAAATLRTVDAALKIARSKS